MIDKRFSERVIVSFVIGSIIAIVSVLVLYDVLFKTIELIFTQDMDICISASTGVTILQKLRKVVIIHIFLCILTIFFSFTRKWNIYYKIFFCAVGFRVGFIMYFFIMSSGFAGIWRTFLVFFPQDFIFLVAYYLLTYIGCINNNYFHSVEYKFRFKQIIRGWILTTGIIALGIITELFINQYIIRWI